jgi:hypothetical protein
VKQQETCNCYLLKYLDILDSKFDPYIHSKLNKQQTFNKEGTQLVQFKIESWEKKNKMQKDTNFRSSISEGKINNQNLNDDEQMLSIPSTTINIDERHMSRYKKISLRKNSLTLTMPSPNEITNGLSDYTKSYIPDFGYTNQLDFERTHGWQFLLDFISKYPKREKTSNLINDLVKAKVTHVAIN